MINVLKCLTIASGSDKIIETHLIAIVCGGIIRFLESPVKLRSLVRLSVRHEDISIGGISTCPSHITYSVGKIGTYAQLLHQFLITRQQVYRFLIFLVFDCKGDFHAIDIDKVIHKSPFTAFPDNLFLHLYSLLHVLVRFVFQSHEPLIYSEIKQEIGFRSFITCLLGEFDTFYSQTGTFRIVSCYIILISNEFKQCQRFIRMAAYGVIPVGFQ